jgi:hypothetical protein
MSLDEVKWFKVRKDAATLENKTKSATKGDLATGNNKGGDGKPSDFSNGPQYFSVLPTDNRFYGEFANRLDDKAVISKMENKNFYEITLTNKGGLVMPVIIEWTFKDGSKEIERLPAEIWRLNETKVTKVFAKDKEVVNIVIDPLKETADISIEDNVFPKVVAPSKFDELKKKGK